MFNASDNSLVGTVPPWLPPGAILTNNCLTNCSYTRQPWCPVCGEPASYSPVPSASVSGSPSPSPTPSPSGTLVPGVPPAQRAALVDLYNATNGQVWANSQGWLTGDPCTGSWFGVTCSPSNTSIVYVDVHRYGSTLRQPVTVVV
jgi:hypothetical protein